MAIQDFTGKNIKDTYQRVIQTDGVNIADGTGSLLPISFNGNNVIISGSLTAQTYVVSESIIAVTSGSTIFGNSEDDTHIFTGAITASSNISCSTAGAQIIATTGSFNHIITDGDTIEFRNKTTRVKEGSIKFTARGLQIRRADDKNAETVTGNVTASGNISASGDIQTTGNLIGTIDGGTF